MTDRSPASKARAAAPTARSAAVHMLDETLGRAKRLSGAVRERATQGLDAAGRAEAVRLANDTLRWLERADRLIDRHARRRPPPRLRNILRLGTTELCRGGDAHGVVNDLVALAAGGGRRRGQGGLVNAVLRKIAEDGAKSWKDLRAPRLPAWLRRPLTKAWGVGAVAAMEVAHCAGAPLDLTAKSDPESLAQTLGGTLLPTGSVRLADPGRVSALPGYDDGNWWVQDAAAALPAALLAPTPGERILDMCAAPGGKTMQLAAAGARVVALDRSERRMQTLKENLRRTGLEAECAISDALVFEGGPFDAILLDPPCSATGTIRRHPDLPYALAEDDLGALEELQSAMLDWAVGLLRPGGRLAYCTCSLLPGEGEAQVAAALLRHEALEADRSALERPGVDPAWITAEGGLRLRPDHWPELGGMDGFYMAALRRR